MKPGVLSASVACGRFNTRDVQPAVATQETAITHEYGFSEIMLLSCVASPDLYL